MNKTDLVNANAGDMVMELCRRLDAPVKTVISRIYLGPLTIPVWALSQPAGYQFGSTRRVYLTPPNRANPCASRHFIMAVCTEFKNKLVVQVELCVGGDNSWGTKEIVQISPENQCNLDKLMGREYAAVFVVDGQTIEVWF